MGNGLASETIFEGTLYENISMGRAFVTSDDVIWATEKVFLKDFIKTLPEGMDTYLSPSGQKLSKGIIQRIILARCIVNHPKLILLENQLDYIEEEERKKIIDFLIDAKNNWTLICVSNDSYLQKQCNAVIDLSQLSTT
jgi:ABC-type bacteriocin/lantibiotic exporter with double-glycine peptidase domain